jgi:putative transposase
MAASLDRVRYPQTAGVSEAQTQTPKIGHPGNPKAIGRSPNDLWCADYKGEFKTRDGLYCYPLTITDDFSRHLLCCQALLSTRVKDAKQVFLRIFREYGLPRQILTDNGVPFATNTLGRLSQLSAWWVKLGIVPVLIQPGCRQQNARHERMHRTLKDEATKPPAGNLRAQQRKFNRFIEEFNTIRPHDALDGETPGQWYERSSRELPSKLLPFEYPDRMVSRYVSANGGIRWRHQWVNVSTTLAGDYVGFEEIDNGLWDVWFGPIKIGRFHERHRRIEDAFARLKRQK